MLRQQSSLSLLYKSKAAKIYGREDLAVFGRRLILNVLGCDFEVMSPVCWVERMTSWRYYMEILYWGLRVSHHSKIICIEGWYYHPPTF